MVRSIWYSTWSLAHGSEDGGCGRSTEGTLFRSSNKVICMQENMCKPFSCFSAFLYCQSYGRDSINLRSVWLRLTLGNFSSHAHRKDDESSWRDCVGNFPVVNLVSTWFQPVSNFPCQHYINLGSYPHWAKWNRLIWWVLYYYLPSEFMTYSSRSNEPVN